MHVSFRQLRLFLALAETGSVTAAARKLHVTQPTASAQLREMTEAVGLPLHEVVGRQVYLTEAGQELAATARAISDQWDAFIQGMDRARGLTWGRLRVSVVSTAANFMPRLLGAFCRQHPGLEVALEILNRDGVVQRLKSNLDDLYIMSMPPTDLELDDQVFMENPLVLITPSRDPLARRTRLPLKAFAPYRFILREKGSGTRMATDRHFRSQGFQPDIRLQLGSNEAIREAVAGGLGVGVISRHALPRGRAGQGLAIADVQGFPIASRWHLVRPAGKRPSPVAQAFRSHLLGNQG